MALTWPYVTTAAKARTFIGDETNVSLDTTLEDDFIKPLTKTFERYLGRELDQIERTRLIRPSQNQKEIALPDYPVTAVSEIKSSADGDWTNQDAWDAADGYFIDLNLGLLRPLNQSKLTRDHMVRIVYTGGLAADFATFETDYPDLVMAGAIWVAELFRRRKNLDKTSSGGGRGKTSTYKDVFRNPPEAARDLMIGYRRRVI